MIGNENVDFTIALQNGSILRWGMEMENAAIVRSGYGGLKNPTIAVHATEGAIDRVLGAADPMDAYKEAERSGQMKIECMTWMSGIKVSAAISAGEAVKPFLSSLKN